MEINGWNEANGSAKNDKKISNFNKIIKTIWKALTKKSGDGIL